MRKLSFLRGGAHFVNIAGVLFSALLCAYNANAAVLVNDGFPVGEGGYDAEKKALNAQAVTHTSVKGFGWEKWNNAGGSSAVYSFGSGSGLEFPALFASRGFEAVGASAGFSSSGGPGNPRCAEKLFDTTSWPTSGKVYLRLLLWADAKGVAAADAPNASTRFTATTSYAAGLSSKWQSGASDYTYFFSSASNLLFGVAKNLDGKAEIELCVIGSDGAKTICTLVSADDFKTDTTYLCLAEIDIDSGTDAKERIRAIAVPGDEWKPNFSWTKIDGDSDAIEAEIWNGDAHATYFGMAGRYQTQNGYVKFDEIAIGTELADVVYYDADYPEIGECSVESGSGGFTVSATSICTIPVRLVAIVDDGASETPVEIAAAAAHGVSESIVLPGLSADRTYAVSVAAENASGAVTNFVGTIYTGTPSLAFGSNADESGFVPGSFTVSRADSSFDLVVSYTCGGTAVNGVNFEELSGSVVIPAGSAAVTVDVKPLFARPHNAATQLDVTLAAGNYSVPDPAPSVSVAIANLAPPADKNTWVAAADGNASVPANWSFGSVPGENDDILLDGAFSTANLTWDGATEGMTDTVKSWTQLANYTGRVTIPTTRTGAFTLFTVKDNAELNGGEWWRSSGTEDVWLNVAVGGNLSVGEGFTFNGNAAGRPKNAGSSPGADKGSGRGASHGGLGADGALPGGGKTYGDYRNPTSLGSGDYGSQAGGGAISLEVAGNFVLDGTVTADAGSSASYGGASGGSVWIRANRMSGTGSVTARGAGSTNNNRYGGGGGRISIQLKSDGFGHAEFNSAFTGTISAAGGFTRANSSPRYAPGAAGTVYVETVADGGNGRMTLSNKTSQDLSKYNAHTAVAAVWTNVTWNISTLELKDNGRVGIKKNAEIHVPTFAAITGDGTDYALLLFDGGTLSSDIRHDRLVADGFAVENVGTSSFVAHALVIPATSSLKVSGDFTVGELKINGDSLAAGDYSAATLAETYSNVSGDGTIHVKGSIFGLSIFVR